jgi:hypothetical protein
MKRPILNRSSNGAHSSSDNIRQLDVSRNAKRAASASVAVAGGAAVGIPGLVDQPRAAISLPTAAALTGAITAPLPAVGILPDGAGKRR